jgi:hypothetical protein
MQIWLKQDAIQLLMVIMDLKNKTNISDFEQEKLHYYKEQFADKICDIVFPN